MSEMQMFGIELVVGSCAILLIAAAIDYKIRKITRSLRNHR